MRPKLSTAARRRTVTPRRATARRDRPSPPRRRRGPAAAAPLDELAARYAAAVDRYAREQPDQWQRLTYSVSLDTDWFVLALLQHVGLYGPQFQRDVLTAVRAVWGHAMRVAPPDDPRLRDATAVMHDLAEQRSKEMYATVYAAKQAYIAQNRDWRPCARGRGLVGCCAVLTCWNPLRVRPGDSLTLNSMHYCWEHRGLALFNGLRHSPLEFCDACAVWNVMGLKTTGGDPGHVHNHIRTLRIPFVHRASGPLNLRVSWFLEPAATFGIWDGRSLRNVGTRGRPQYRPATGGPPRRVPAHAFARLRRNGYADAWILVQRESVRDGRLVPITENQALDEVFEQIPGGNPLLRDRAEDWGGGGGW